MSESSPATTQPESIVCISLPPFQRGDWTETANAFADAPPATLGQAWRDEPEADFLLAHVRVGRQGKTLLVYAELEDRDIYTDATESGQQLWELGDTFEIFIRPCCHDEYYELHTAPNNCTLQMRFESAEAFQKMCAAGNIDLRPMRLSEPMMQTWVKEEAENNRWYVLAAIEGLHLPEDDRQTPSYQVIVSFSRYDYTRQRAMPVISSTSSHAVTNFHRMQEWRPLAFEAD